MKPKFIFIASFIALLIFPKSELSAQEKQDQAERTQAVNICAIAIPLINNYVVNYEYLYRQRHGFAARLEYAPGMKGSNTKGVALAGVLNYRWHFSPKLDGFFVGPYARYRYVYGSGETNAQHYDFKVPELNIGANAGYRWVSKIGFNFVIAAGYGYSFTNDILSNSNTDITNEFNAFKKANNAIMDAPFYGEISIGYAF